MKANKTEKMSITKALATLKLLEKKIQKKTRSNFTGMSVAGKVQDNFDSKEAQNNLKSVYALIERRQNIRDAIQKSNLNTKITIDGKKMTVASAINFKETISYKRDLYERLGSQYNEVERAVGYKNQEMTERLDAQTQRMGDENKTKELTAFSNSFRSMYEAKIIDACDAQNEFKKLEEEILEFESEIDFTLSTSNSLTEIEV